MEPQVKQEQKPPAVKVILIPNFPVEDELKFIVSLAMKKPFREPRKDLLGNSQNWSAAYQHYIKELGIRTDSGDEYARLRLKEIKHIQTGTCETYRKEYKEQLKSKNVHIVTIDWPGLIMMGDPEIAKKYGLEKGLAECCWNCAKRNTKLMHCSRCQKARYCSGDCQKQAWWHHKNTTSKKYGCN